MNIKFKTKCIKIFSKIRDHPARIRRRSSMIPTTTSIVEDSFLEGICNDMDQEPEAAADKLSRNDRKRFVKTLSQKLIDGDYC